MNRWDPPPEDVPPDRPSGETPEQPERWPETGGSLPREGEASAVEGAELPPTGEGEARAAAVPAGYPFWGYSDLGFFLLLALPSLVVASLFVQLFLMLFGIRLPGRAAPLLAAQFLAYGFWFVGLFLLLRLRYGAPFWPSLAFLRPLRLSWAAIFFAGPALAFGVGILGALLQTPEIDTPMRELMTDRTSLVLIGAFAISLGPLFEELAFRGFLMPLLMRSFGVVAGVFLAALPFALLHGPQYAWSWRHVLLITLAGAAFGWVRVRTGSTAAATVMHSTYNLTFFVGFVMQEGGLPAQW